MFFSRACSLVLFKQSAFSALVYNITLALKILADIFSETAAARVYTKHISVIRNAVDFDKMIASAQRS